MWPGPYGDFASRKYILASAEQSLTRMGLDYVDIFYSHRVDPVTPIAETVGALDTLVRQGKALYVGISSYSAERTRGGRRRGQGARHAAGDPPAGVLDPQPLGRGRTRPTRCEANGLGAIAFTPLAQGLLTDKYLGDGTADRAQQRGSLPEGRLSDDAVQTLRSLNEIARERGQSLAQLALQWTLRNPVVASALIGASRTSAARREHRRGQRPAADRGGARAHRRARRFHRREPVGEVLGAVTVVGS